MGLALPCMVMGVGYKSIHVGYRLHLPSHHNHLSRDATPGTDEGIDNHSEEDPNSSVDL